MASQAGLIHADLHLSNVFVLRAGPPLRLVLSDFAQCAPFVHGNRHALDCLDDILGSVLRGSLQHADRRRPSNHYGEWATVFDFHTPTIGSLDAMNAAMRLLAIDKQYHLRLGDAADSSSSDSSSDSDAPLLLQQQQQQQVVGGRRARSSSSSASSSSHSSSSTTPSLRMRRLRRTRRRLLLHSSSSGPAAAAAGGAW